jgi:hypothetical protein
MYSPSCLLFVQSLNFFCLYIISCLFPVQPILFVVSTAHPLCCPYILSSLLSAQPIPFALCTTYLVCCLYSPSFLFVFCLQIVAYPVCSLYNKSCLLSAQPTIFAVCTAYTCMYTGTAHPFATHECTAHPVFERILFSGNTVHPVFW